jgi:hypothetical protein
MVCDISPHRRDFVSRSVHVASEVYEVALEQVALRVLRISPVTIIPPLLYAHLHIHTATRRINGRRLRTFQKGMLFRKSGSTRCRSNFIPVSPLQLFYTPLAPLRITTCNDKKSTFYAHSTLLTFCMNHRTNDEYFHTVHQLVFITQR